MQRILRFTLAAALLSVLSVCAYAGPDPAEEPETEHRAQGYAFFAPSGVFTKYGHTGTVHFGGGGEALVYKGIGIGAELGYLAPWKYMGSGIGMLSVDGSYHFTRNRKVSPFITGGYSLAFRDGHINLVNFGGGMNWWVTDRFGLRLEFRDHLYRQTRMYPTQNVHYLGGRIGVAFR